MADSRHRFGETATKSAKAARAFEGGDRGKDFDVGKGAYKGPGDSVYGEEGNDVVRKTDSVREEDNGDSS